MVHGNCNGLPLADDDMGLVRMNNEIDHINKSYPKCLVPGVVLHPSECTTLSTLSNAFVRRTATTHDGREYRFPYIKRVNCTTKALSSEFVKKFVNLVDKAVCTRGVKFIFQMVLGSGAYEGHGDKGLSSTPHRNIVMGLVLDVFYMYPSTRHLAQALHDEFGDLVESSRGEDIRMTWGSFGEIDMHKVHGEYYGRDNDLYERL